MISAPTRPVYLKLIGTPHTSNRIDEAVIEVAGTKYKCTDIDGVDLKRYFQWEDSAIIDIELDFPAIKSGTKRFVLHLTTARSLGDKCC